MRGGCASKVCHARGNARARVRPHLCTSRASVAVRLARIFIILTIAAAGCSKSSPTAPTTATLSGVTFAANPIESGLTVTATVSLNAAAPAGGAVVTLTSSGDAATVPASVTIAAGALNQTFDIQTSPATVSTSVVITATYAGVSSGATLTLGKLSLQGLSLSAPSVVGGGSVGGIVSLTAPAPPGGVQLTLTSDSALASVPAVLSIAAGDTSQTFQVLTHDSAAPVNVTITASLPYSASTRSTVLTVGRVGIQAVSLGIDHIPGGLPVTGTVMLSVSAPVDMAVTLSSNSPVATVPPMVVVAAGTTSQTFDISTTAIPPTRTATITASSGSSSQSAQLTVIALPSIAGVSCSSTTPKGGSSVSCTARFDAPAPAGGWQIAIASSDDTLAGAVPTNMAVPAGSTSFQFEVLTAPVTSTLTASIIIEDASSGLQLYTQALTIMP